jgi:hypothetical protein
MATDLNRIAEETARVVKTRLYVAGELRVKGQVVVDAGAVVRIPDALLDESINSYSCHRYDEVDAMWARNRGAAQVYQQSSITVVNADSLEIAAELQRQGFNPAVCMPCDPKKAGGGYLNGSTNMESEVYRRTNISQLTAMRQFQHLDGSSYMKTLLIRYPRDQGWKFHKEPVLVGLVATPSIPCYPGNRPRKKTSKLEKDSGKNEDPCKTIDDGKLRFNSRHRMRVIRRLRHSLQLTLLQGHDSVVLTAAGCGANGNPPFETARTFKEAIEPYRKYFQRITFAIIDDSNAFRNSNVGNYLPFKAIFFEKEKGQEKGQTDQVAGKE